MRPTGHQLDCYYKNTLFRFDLFRIADRRQRNL